MIDIPAAIINEQFLERIWDSPGRGRMGIIGDDDALAVTFNAGLTVNIAAALANGAVVNDTVLAAVTATTQTMATADATNPRRDVVYVDTAGVIGTVTGTPAASPVAPTLAVGRLALAEVAVAATQTVLASSDIYDQRPILDTFVKRQTADGTAVNNSVTLVNQNLVLPIGVSERWYYEFALYLTMPSTAGARFAITFPAGATMLFSGFGINDGNASAILAVATSITQTASGTAIVLPAAAASLSSIYLFRALVNNSTTAGAVTLQMAQSTAVVGDNILKANSLMIARRVNA